ncbi:MAG: transglutaminase family protein [Acidobacteria bacterium]|nr:transglutaminase family protein [Acidobacteriota bacterium]
MMELADFLTGRSDLDLDHAALLLATVEYPGLDIAWFLQLLDFHAAELGGRLRGIGGGQAFVSVANAYLFGELELHGNTDDYYNPSNSCLNDVLTARHGIPITLSVVYLEIARRLGKPAFGIGMPGHFLIQYDDGSYSTYIDPFHQGRLLDVVDCVEMARSIAGVELARDPSVLARVGKRQIVARMINNLRGIYFSRRMHRKALSILDLLIAVDPGSADEYKQRGIVYLQLEQLRKAKADLERYLTLSPTAQDRAEIEKQLTALRRWVVGLN